MAFGFAFLALSPLIAARVRDEREQPGAARPVAPPGATPAAFRPSPVVGYLVSFLGRKEIKWLISRD
jgi:hypothetical protein